MMMMIDTLSERIKGRQANHADVSLRSLYICANPIPVRVGFLPKLIIPGNILRDGPEHVPQLIPDLVK